MILQQQMFSDRLTIIDEVTGFEVGEIRGNELRWYGSGCTVYPDQKAAIEAASKRIKEDITVKPATVESMNTNQIKLF